MKTTIYTANPKTHFFKELQSIVKDIKDSRFLAHQTAKRDIQAQYRQSLFGFAWALAPVVTTTLIWVFLKTSESVTLGQTAVPYLLYITLGTTFWTTFVDAANNPIASVNKARGIISKINFPKEALLVSGMYGLLVNFGVKMILVILLLFYFKVAPSSTILFFPIYLAVLILMGSTIGILLAPIGLLYTDVGRAMQLGFTFLMYLVPVVYPIPTKGNMKMVFELNPLTHILNSARNTLIGGNLDQPDLLWFVIPICLVLLAIGLVIFRNSMNIIIEKISN